MAPSDEAWDGHFNCKRLRQTRLVIVTPCSWNCKSQTCFVICLPKQVDLGMGLPRLVGKPLCWGACHVCGGRFSLLASAVASACPDLNIWECPKIMDPNIDPK